MYTYVNTLYVVVYIQIHPLAAIDVHMWKKRRKKTPLIADISGGEGGRGEEVWAKSKREK